MCSPEGAKLATERGLVQVKGTGNPAGFSARVPPLCGSGLARDGIRAVYLQNRGACIASKPAPTGGWSADRSPVADQVYQAVMPVELEVATGTRLTAEQNHFAGQAHRLLECDDNLDIGRRQV